MKAILDAVLFRPWVIGLGIATILLAAFGVTDAWSATAVVMLAFVQNVAYSLQSRARMRSSNLYHALAALTATAVFFMTLRFLFASTVPLALIVPYTLGTVAGTLQGVRLSQWIEEKIGAVANLGEEVKGQTLPFGTAVIGLAALAIAQLALVGSGSAVHMAAILTATFVANFLFSGLTVARNTNAYWSHLGFILLQSAVGFLTYGIMLDVNGNWFLFAPFVTGTMLGSIAGARVGKQIESMLKSSWDAHVLERGATPWPVLEAGAVLVLALPQVALFGLHPFALLVFFAALTQNCAFALVSRARQRRHEGYLEWTSVLSNGIWFLTLGFLVMGNLEIALIIPYVAGTAIGSLLGQGMAMRIEKRIGAMIDAPGGERAHSA